MQQGKQLRGTLKTVDKRARAIVLTKEVGDDVKTRIAWGVVARKQSHAIRAKQRTAGLEPRPREWRLDSRLD
jgi:hypothetical protein